MDAEQIEAFFSVCEYEGFTSASRHVHISQSTLSRRIAALEEELGAALFLRNAQGIELTDAGKVFYQDAGDILQKMKSLRSKISAIGSGEQGRIEVGMPLNLFGKNAVMGVYSSAAQLPGVEVNYSLLNFESMNKGLLNRKLDVIITYDFAIREVSEELEYKFIFKEPFVFFARQGHPLCREVNATEEKLIQSDLAIIDTSINPPFLNHVLHQARMVGKGKIHTATNHESMLLQVSTSDAIGVCPRTLYESFREMYGLCAVPITEIDTSADFVLAWRKGNEDPLVQVYNDHIRRYVWNHMG